jgi:hypothetical protein
MLLLDKLEYVMTPLAQEPLQIYSLPYPLPLPDTYKWYYHYAQNRSMKYLDGLLEQLVRRLHCDKYYISTPLFLNQ